MESDLQQHPQMFRNRQPMNSGLMRYRSAPSSYFQEQVDRELCSQFFKKPSSPETERIFAQFMSSGAEDQPAAQNLGGFGQEHLIKEEIKVEESQQALILPQMNQEAEIQQQQQASNYSSSQHIYQNLSHPPLPNQNPSSSANYRGASSSGMHQFPPMRTGGGLNTKLTRHSSSPAGLFADLDIDIAGYAAMGSVGNFASAGRIQSQSNYSSAKPPPSSSGLMSPIAEIENKSMKAGSPLRDDFGEASITNYTPSFVTSSWEDPAMMSEDVNSLKRQRDDEGTMYSGLSAPQAQSSNPGSSRPPLLTHHLSLPKTLPDMDSMEKFMQFPDSVPCKIRAKRGCATHPRSIAERVRRTKISERMRKLQELVPNMDKQTNTAEMLDLAVVYIKDLQGQVKVLSDNRAKCTCSIEKQ